jgi:acyl carrier protein
MSVDEVTGLIGQILDTGAGIGPAARLEADLQLESLDLLALDDLLRRRYGDGVALCAHLATLDFDTLVGLTVGDVAEYVAGAGR